MRRAVRGGLALAALPLLATFAPVSLFSMPALPAASVLTFEPVSLDRKEPARRRLGKLIYLAGWQIRSNDRRFGGISAIHVEAGEVTALSDAGTVIRFKPGARRANLFSLPDGPGSAGKKGDRDVEAMAVNNERAWIGFERTNAVWRYRRGSWTSDAATLPPGMEDWPSNKGSEAMLRLPGGKFLIFSEGEPVRGGTEALLFEGDPAKRGTKTRRLRYLPPEGYRITDAALLPDGRMLFLNRSFGIPEGFTAKLTIAEKPSLEDGATLSGAEIAHFQSPVTVDNMEALSVGSEKGHTILWIASDDNLNPLQRTLLLKFALGQ